MTDKYHGFLTFKVERWNSFWPECIPLWMHQYSEMSREPVQSWEPDVELYRFLDGKGRLQILTARQGNGRIVGYQMSIIQRHPHYAQRLASFDDTVFLEPEWRHGWHGYKMLKAVVQTLQARGCKMIFLHEKDYWANTHGKGIGSIYRRLGFRPSDRLWVLST
jgi:GNAT superfamily N-acetyltransferase